MAYQLKEINDRIRSDPKAFLAECDAAYDQKVAQAAEQILENTRHSPVVLLSGPSGSGKTTTAMKLDEELERRGVRTHSVGMDDYFRSVDPRTTPRTPEGELDLESPKCLDMDLLNEHFTLLSQGKTVIVPKYEFSRQMRVIDPSRRLRLKKDEIVIFEGIHALNDDITQVHPEAFKLYISARSNVLDEGALVFKGTWMRLMRRTVRDHLFRGADAAYTLRLWANVRRGEKKNISPFKNKANFQFDTSFPYEVSVLKDQAAALFATVPDGTERYEELHSIVPALERFLPIDPALVKPDALLREFIGGGIYEY